MQVNNMTEHTGYKPCSELQCAYVKLHFKEEDLCSHLALICFIDILFT